jgi:membrane associated rhomboid family serine protease
MLQALPPPDRPREPVFNVPIVVALTIGTLVLVHVLRSVLSDGADVGLLFELAFIPAQWTVAFEPAKAAEILSELAARRLI